MEYVIKVEKLSKSYESCVAVENLSFAVKKGTVFGLLGANGAGKSTSIECILGTKKIASLYKNPANYKELLQRFGIEEKSKTLVKALSGGEKQRLFIILALIPNPEVVFLDELTTGLDARARRDVWQILKDLKEKGLTIMLTSHFMDEVEELCDIICILKKEKVVFQGTVKEAIKASPYEKLEDAYLWYTDKEVM